MLAGENKLKASVFTSRKRRRTETASVTKTGDATRVRVGAVVCYEGAGRMWCKACNNRTSRSSNEMVVPAGKRTRPVFDGSVHTRVKMGGHDV